MLASTPAASTPVASSWQRASRRTSREQRAQSGGACLDRIANVGHGLGERRSFATRKVAVGLLAERHAPRLRHGLTIGIVEALHARRAHVDAQVVGVDQVTRPVVRVDLIHEACKFDHAREFIYGHSAPPAHTHASPSTTRAPLQRVQTAPPSYSAGRVTTGDDISATSSATRAHDSGPSGVRNR